MDERELKRNRGAVSIALVDNNISVANALRGGLRVLGYGTITLYRDAKSLEAALYGPGFDLIIGDADFDDGALLDIVRRLRDGDIGRNPFAAVIVTSWRQGWATVRKAIDAGVDDFLVNPISHGRLAERMQAIVDRRKPFIVTADYTGPERRRDPNRASTIPGFFPPNSLAEKERGRFVDDSDLKWRIDVSAREISQEKFRRSIFQLAFLRELADRAVKRDNAPTTTIAYLSELKKQGQRAANLARINGEPELIKQIAKIIRVAEEMVNSVPTHTGLVILRKEVDRALSKIFTEQSLPETLMEVELAIRGYEQLREEQLAVAG